MKGISPLLIITIIFATYNSCARQNIMMIDDIKEIWVYDYFNPKGYTRGEVHRKFQELENNQTAKILLDSVFVDAIKNLLICSAKHKRLLPSKCGQNLIFAEFILQDNSSRNIIIASNGIFDYHVGLMGYFFIDSFEKKDKTLWINNFFEELMNKINPNTKDI